MCRLILIAYLAALGSVGFAGVTPDPILEGVVKDTTLSAAQAAPAAAAPSAVRYIGGLNAGKIQPFSLLDLDTSGSTHEYDLGVSLRFTGSGGSVAAATSSNPLRVDPTGTTSQPVVQTTGTNLHTVTDTGSVSQVSQATAANLNATVVQATGANLHVVTDTTSTTISTQATAANLNATVVQGTAANLNATVVQSTGTNLHVVVDSGAIVASPPSVSSATLTSVVNAITTTVLLASNAARKGASFYNDSVTNCDIAFAATASLTAFTLKLTAGSSYIMDNKPLYTGAVAGICDSATGSIRVTEL